MHDDDKLGQAAASKLIRSKNKIAVNMFPSGVDLMNLSMKLATHFSCRTRIKNIHNICKITYSPIIKSNVDNNGIRVAAQQRLLESLIPFNNGLHIYQVQNRGSIRDSVTATDANWRQFGEFEAVLNNTQVVTTIAQYEDRYVASYGHIMNLLTYKNIAAGELYIIDQDEVTKYPNIPRKISEVD